MEFKKIRKAAVKPAALFGCALVASAVPLPAERASAQIGTNDTRIAAGYAATPVPLNLAGKDPKQVGLGSYIVNTAGVCNHCHSSSQYTMAGNPYDLPPPNGPYTGRIVNGATTFVIDTTTFLAGGSKFGAVVFAKNLTPDTTGYASGGMDWTTFLNTMRNGTDPDSLHPTCTGTNGPSCVASPANGALLQTMPWPAVAKLSDSDLNAVWQYLSAIPCISNTTNVNTTFASAHTSLINNCPASGSITYKYYKYIDGRVVPKS